MVGNPERTSNATKLKRCRYLHGVELHMGKESSHKDISVSNITVKITPNLVILVFHSAMKSLAL